MEKLVELIKGLEVKIKNENEILNEIKQTYEKVNRLVALEEVTKEKLNLIVKDFSQDESEIVKFNVSGTYLATLKSTITKKIKKEESDEFYEANLLEEFYNESVKNKSSMPFIDRNPMFFSFILDYLRNPNEDIDFIEDEYHIKKLLAEAKYFKANGLVKKLEKLLYLDSIILNNLQLKDLFKLCDFDMKSKWRLLYRASVDGFSANDFHRKCDSYTKTLTIIKSENGNVFGGYTTKPWTIAGGWVNDASAFIFRVINKLNQPVKMNCINQQYAFYCNQGYGPTFGGGHDFHICSDSNKTNSSYSNLLHSYKSDQLNLTLGTEQAKSFLAGSYHFLTTEIEVFHLTS